MPTSDKNIKAEVLCDIINPFGDRWTCFKATYPRIIMAEINTHRSASRTSASSRAIPIWKQIEKVKTNPFIPSWIGKNQGGMQAAEELSEEDQKKFKKIWLDHSVDACHTARLLESIGVHKQITNRVLEPWLYVDTLIAGTEWANFFHLRLDKHAQPEFMILAHRMAEAYQASKPIEVSEGWHGPFMDQMPPGHPEEERKKIAVARCARISYDNFDGKRDAKDDLRLAESLLKNKHMSPFEFVVTPAKYPDMVMGNLKGFVQYRKTIQGEARNKVNLKKLIEDAPEWI